MAPDTSGARFRVDGNALKTAGRLTLEDTEAFSSAIQELLDTPNRELVLDLSATAFISSRHIGCIAAAIEKVEEEGRALSILANEKVAFILSITGLDSLCDVRVVAPPP